MPHKYPRKNEAAFRAIVGENIRRERERLGLSQDEVMRRADLPIQTGLLSRIEAGERVPSLQDALAIAKAMQVKIEVLTKPTKTEAK